MSSAAASPSKYENHSEQKDHRRCQEIKHDDDEYEEEAQFPEREKAPTPAWMRQTGGGANLSPGFRSRSVKWG